jgi:hypothetical protein
MIIRPRSKSVRRIAAAGAALAVALLLSGASSPEFQVIGKDDRPPSVADCRDPDLVARDACSGVSLPETATESYTVMPGLTIVEQVAG